MEECIQDAEIYTYNENEDGIDRYSDLEPIFVSRMPRRKVTGEAHMETIRRLKKDDDGLKSIIKKGLTELKLKDGEIEGYPEKNKRDDRLLYESLLKRLMEFGGDAKKAFNKPFYKPKSDGTVGPLVKKVKIESKTTMGVEFNNIKAIADNGGMVRIDVFYVENEGYYFVPIYIADTVKNKLPNRACIQGKKYDDWKDMKEEDFIFSLYPNDLIHIVSKNKIKLNGNKNKEKTPIEAKEIYGYYIKAGISVAQITIISHDNEFIQPSLGIKGLELIEKYQVDVLGNYTKVRIPEKRIDFKNRKGEK